MVASRDSGFAEERLADPQEISEPNILWVREGLKVLIVVAPTHTFNDIIGNIINPVEILELICIK